MFKLTQAAGRLQLIVYKEPPATAVNEIKEISIDQFGGLENNLRLDGEKFVFAIITTTITECFSVETPQELSDWSQLLQEYLGKGKYYSTCWCKLLKCWEWSMLCYSRCKKKG